MSHNNPCKYLMVVLYSGCKGVVDQEANPLEREAGTCIAISTVDFNVTNEYVRSLSGQEKTTYCSYVTQQPVFVSTKQE